MSLLVTSLGKLELVRKLFQSVYALNEKRVAVYRLGAFRQTNMGSHGVEIAQL